MKFSSLSAIAQAMFLYGVAHGKRATVGQPIPEGAVIGPDKADYTNEWGVPSSFFCSEKLGYFTVSPDKRYAGCCPDKDQTLFGPVNKFELHCCAAGHSLAGSPEAGYECCPNGYDEYDGVECKQVCKNGKKLVDGKCQCPDGLSEAADGTCKEVGCSSGLVTGKCYQLKGANGQLLSFFGGQYSQRAPDKNSIPGKFQFCRDEKCTPGLPVNPSSGLYLKDLHGSLADGSDAGQWVNKNAEGAHIGRDPSFTNAGQFSITKWSCGKYCLTGLAAGLGQACPVVDPSITFYASSTQACVEFDLIEVPCDVRSDQNNCLWESCAGQCANQCNGNQCNGK